MKIAISAESTLDLSKELIDKYEIHTIPFNVHLGEKTAIDGQISLEEIYDYVDENKILPRTSAINEFQYEEYFKSILEKGYDALIHFSLSSEISSTYQNAVNASKNFKNVYVIDSKSLSTGIALQAIYASKLSKTDLDVKEVVKKCEARVNKVQASFVLNTVDYLHHGGRCSSVAKFGVNLLRLKPQIIVKDGKMESGKIFHGKNEMVVADYCKSILEKFKNPDLSVGFVTHSGASPEMIETAKKTLIAKGFKEIYETVAGATIAAHCGPKCIGILFINDGPHEI